MVGYGSFVKLALISKHHTSRTSAVYFQGKRFIQFDVGHIRRLRCHRQGSEPVPVQKVFSVFGYRNIINAQGCDIVKKMRPLGRVGLQLGLGCFNHGTHPANLSPFYGYSQPAVGRSPSPRAD